MINLILHLKINNCSNISSHYIVNEFKVAGFFFY